MDTKKETTAKQVSAPEDWVELYGDSLYRYALSRIQDNVAAEDLVQETFLAALGSYKNFQGRSSEKTWLTAILKHKIVDHFRRKSREYPTEDIETLSDTTEDFFNEKGDWKLKPAKWTVDPRKLIEIKEFRRVLSDCLTELSSRLSRVFILRELEDLDTAEICKALNITASNCWVILYRARMKMRRCLEFNWFEGETIDQS